MDKPQAASDLSSEDFELFWEWLTFNNSHALSKNKAETIKVIRVFDTLDMFESNAALVEFVKSWDCDYEQTLEPFELRIGLLRLSERQFQKFYRFIMALKKKEREDDIKEKQKMEEEQIIRRRKHRKGNQFEKAMAARILKRKRSLSVHPAEIAEKKVTDKTEKMNIFKEKHGLKQKKTPIVRFLKTIRSISERSVKVVSSPLKLLNRASSAPVASCIISPSSTTRTNGMSPDNTMHAGEGVLSTDESEDGFTARLSKANLSIFHEDICGDDAITSYRSFRLPSDIVESLESFGSFYNSSDFSEQQTNSNFETVA